MFFNTILHPLSATKQIIKNGFQPMTTPTNKVQSILQLSHYICGFLSLVFLISALITLFTQPFKTAYNNDLFFGISFLTGCFFTALFLWTANKLSK